MEADKITNRRCDYSSYLQSLIFLEVTHLLESALFFLYIFQSTKKKFKKSDQLVAAAPSIFGCGDTIERQIETDTTRVLGNNYINR